ncbi:uncharacterized protein BDW70DRAFT_164747 [Aspergillus foveolatus]|uniref:uncharacterized protein n=1 Tax=Aspergillus foveolatus TaxID=210207 RepID=UPI003CCE2BFC
MSSARSVPHPAFIEEYDEDAEAILPDTRQVATSLHQPSIERAYDGYQNAPVDVSHQSPLFDSLYDWTEPRTPLRTRTHSSVSSEEQLSRRHGRISPLEDLFPFNDPPWVNRSADALFDEIERVRSLHTSSPTGARVATRYPYNHRTNEDSTTSLPPEIAPVRRYDDEAVSRRHRSRQQKSPSTKPQGYWPPSGRHSQPYVQPPYTIYHPSYYPSPYAYQSLPPPSTSFRSAYASPHYWSPPGISYPPHGSRPHGSAPSSAGENPNPINEATPQVNMHLARRAHRFINLRTLQSDREEHVPGKISRPWRTLTKEIPVNIPGRPKMKLERYDIVQSRVVSVARFGKENAAILTYDAAQDEERRSETCWMHHTSDTMELVSFMMESLRLKEVPENAFPIITELFKELEQGYEKPFVHGRYLEPTVRRFVGGDSDEDGKKPKPSVDAVFIAFPYLSLEPFRPQPSTRRESVHPVRSLLQFHYCFVSTVSRDEDQVSCNTGNQLCGLHVPQVWILLINNDLIISTGPVDINAVRGKYIHLEKASPPPSFREQRKICIHGLQGKQYCFSLNQCKTWFEFLKTFLGVLDPGQPLITLFVNDSWRNKVQLLVGNEPVSETNWADIVNKTEPGDITIRLVQRASSPEPQNISLVASGTRNPEPAIENQLVIASKSHANPRFFLPKQPSEYSDHHPYYLYNTKPFPPFGDSTWYAKPYIDIPGRHSSNATQALVVRPTNTGRDTQHRRYRNDKRKLLTFRGDTEQRNAQPIWLTDLSGTRLQIPWRIGCNQNTSERRQAFIAGNYVLDGPDGPIAPVDWNDEVYPGISVTIRLKNGDVQNELEDNLSQSAKAEQSFSRLNPADEDTVSLFGDGVGEKGGGAGDNDADSMSNKDRQSSSAGSSPDSVTSRADDAINVFDYLESEEDDDKHLDRKDPLGETLVEPRSSSPIPSTTLDPLSSSSPTTSSATTPCSTLPSDQAAFAAAPALPDSASISGMCPLFESKIESKINHDFLGDSTNERFEKREPNDWGDSGVGTLLEGCDKEALYILRFQPDESAVMNRVSNSTYMKVQVEMERMRVRLFHLGEDSDSDLLERQVWARKERVIQAAMHLLDCFIPLHYQKLDESWLIGKFFGAICDIVRGSEFHARRNPSSDLFDALQQLMEEIQILHLILDQQLNLLDDTLEVLSSSEDLPTKLSESAISRSRQHLKQTQHDLSQLESMAERAAVALRYMLEVRKESNRKAITLFTIVTVIFLPLSFVTSYLGMNSVAIRGGSFTQGLFWAVAIPIAAFLVGGLYEL